MFEWKLKNNQCGNLSFGWLSGIEKSSISAVFVDENLVNSNIFITHTWRKSRVNILVISQFHKREIFLFAEFCCLFQSCPKI